MPGCCLVSEGCQAGLSHKLKGKRTVSVENRDVCSHIEILCSANAQGAMGAVCYHPVVAGGLWVDFYSGSDADQESAASAGTLDSGSAVCSGSTLCPESVAAESTLGLETVVCSVGFPFSESAVCLESTLCPKSAVCSESTPCLSTDHH